MGKEKKVYWHVKGHRMVSSLFAGILYEIFGERVN